MPKNSNRGRNNNPSGRNQYSGDWGVTELVRERPIAAAAAAAGAAAAGLFLWSRRAQISNQLTNLSDQIGEWTEAMGSRGGDGFEMDDTAGLTTPTKRSGAGSRSASGTRSATTNRSRSTTGKNRGMSETGGGMGTGGNS